MRFPSLFSSHLHDIQPKDRELAHQIGVQPDHLKPGTREELGVALDDVGCGNPIKNW